MFLHRGAAKCAKSRGESFPERETGVQGILAPFAPEGGPSGAGSAGTACMAVSANRAFGCFPASGGFSADGVLLSMVTSAEKGIGYLGSKRRRTCE